MKKYTKAQIVIYNLQNYYDVIMASGPQDTDTQCDLIGYDRNDWFK